MFGRSLINKEFLIRIIILMMNYPLNPFHRKKRIRNLTHTVRWTGCLMTSLVYLQYKIRLGRNGC